ncbi:MAG: hypothetical protein M5U08_23100 [Burkholderiales bacterium]|nr:hypothetical protein [Burkholderiales bacterium]
MRADRITFSIAPDHPALPGHFPGDPVVPGVLVLAHVQAALAARRGPLRLTGVPQAKFLAPLVPGEPCTIVFAHTSAGETRFECTSGARSVARGVLRFAADDHHRD